MKTNNSHTSNLLRDLYLQNYFHGKEFVTLLAFGWSPFSRLSNMRLAPGYSY